MTTLHTLKHVVEHADRWGIPDHEIKQVTGGPGKLVFLLPDKDIDLFARWAKNLDDRWITGLATGSVGRLRVTGQILSGHRVEITVLLDGGDMRRLGLVGNLALGEVEQAARKLVAA